LNCRPSGYESDSAAADTPANINPDTPPLPLSALRRTGGKNKDSSLKWEIKFKSYRTPASINFKS
jgi:hypothetical protein